MSPPRHQRHGRSPWNNIWRHCQQCGSGAACRGIVGNAAETAIGPISSEALVLMGTCGLDLAAEALCYTEGQPLSSRKVLQLNN